MFFAVQSLPTATLISPPSLLQEDLQFVHSSCNSYCNKQLLQYTLQDATLDKQDWFNPPSATNMKHLDFF